MCGDNGSKIHTRLGIVAGFIKMPSHLRFCPLCMEDDQKQFGEVAYVLFIVNKDFA